MNQRKLELEEKRAKLAAIREEKRRRNQAQQQQQQQKQQQQTSAGSSPCKGSWKEGTRSQEYKLSAVNL